MQILEVLPGDVQIDEKGNVESQNWSGHVSRARCESPGVEKASGIDSDINKAEVLARIRTKCRGPGFRGGGNREAMNFTVVGGRGSLG